MIVVAVVALIAGLALGYVVAPRQAPAAGSAAQVAADNALVDQWNTVQNTGTREQFDAMVRPTVHFASTYGAAFTYSTADPLWLIIEHARTVDKFVHTRTSDVSRYGNVIVWSGTWYATPTPSSLTQYVRMVWLDKNGKFLNIYETVY
jgi:hypothetical protein